jgi:polysaccharide export outer membrane protein
MSSNNYKLNYRKNIWLALVAGCLFLASCSGGKKISYFKDIPDSLKTNPMALQLGTFKDPQIQPNDILQISVQTLDPQANSVMNAQNAPTFSVLPTGGTSPSVPGTGVQGYLVDKNGNIELPMVGKVAVQGKNTTEIKELIYNKVSRFYKEPVVNVRLANFNVTVLGEVNKPATYTVPNEKVSLLDAIGMAGDLTIFGKRDNVLLIREEGGQKLFVRFNLNNSSMFQSPYFYLHQGDVVYVEPNKAKVASTDGARTRTYTILASAFSVIIVLLSRINF